MCSSDLLTYNRERYVARAIEAVLRQTYRDFEFIIIDNGSLDRSGEIAEEYAKKDSRILTEHIKAGSIGRGRNAGVSKARGEYVAFVDDDDVAACDMLEFLYGLITENQAEIAICGAQKNVNGKILPHSIWEESCVWDAEEAVAELLKRKRNNAGMPTKLIKKELLDREPFKENCHYEDIWVCYKYMAMADKTAAYGLPKYCFTRHTGNNSSFTQDASRWRPEQIEEYLAAFRERTEYISAKLPGLTDMVRYSEWSYMISMCDKIKTYRLTGCGTVFSQMADALRKNRQEFMDSSYIQEFEKNWMAEYGFLEG